MLSGTSQAGCLREVAALHSDHLRQVPLYHKNLGPYGSPQSPKAANNSFAVVAIMALLPELTQEASICG